MVRLASTKALHIRTAGYVTFEEAGGALVAAEEIDMPDQRPVQATALPSTHQVIDLVARKYHGESSVIATPSSKLGSK
jgi:hypothetical protein